MVSQSDALWYEASWQLFWGIIFLTYKSLILDNLGTTKDHDRSKWSSFTLYFMDMCGISYTLRALFCYMVVWWHSELCAFCLATMSLYNIAPFLLILKHGSLFAPGTRKLSL